MAKVYLSIRRSNEGAASAIAAMFIVMILVLILSQIIVTYVPRWVEENEERHMQTVITQFMELRGVINTQMEQNDDALERAAPLTLGNKGVDIFTPPTKGTLRIEPRTSLINVYNDSRELNATSRGNIRFESQNRRYIDLEIVYEAGAVIINQTSGDIMLAEPSFSAENGTSIVAALTIVSLVGGDDTITGIGTIGVITRMLLYESETYTWALAASENVSINITTAYSAVWYKYFYETLDAAGIQKGPGGQPLTRAELVDIRDGFQGLNWVKNNISANVGAPVPPAWINENAAKQVNIRINQTIQKVDKAIDAIDEGDEDKYVKSIQQAVDSAYRTIDRINGYKDDIEVNKTYKSQLITWMEAIIARLQGELVGGTWVGYNIQFYEDGLRIKLSGVTRFTLNYALVETKLSVA